MSRIGRLPFGGNPDPGAPHHHPAIMPPAGFVRGAVLCTEPNGPWSLPGWGHYDGPARRASDQLPGGVGALDQHARLDDRPVDPRRRRRTSGGRGRRPASSRGGGSGRPQGDRRTPDQSRGPVGGLRGKDPEPGEGRDGDPALDGADRRGRPDPNDRRRVSRPRARAGARTAGTWASSRTAPVATPRPASGKKNNKTQVWLLDRRGGEAVQLTEIEEGVEAFEWAPDCRRLALVIRDPKPERKPTRAPRRRRRSPLPG